MKSFEKTIKYIATGFAVLLAVSIIVGILNIVLTFVSSISGKDANLTDYSKSFGISDVKSIYIYNGCSDVNIVSTSDSEIKVEGKNVYNNFKCSVNSKGLLTISNKSSKNGFFSFFQFRTKSGEITIYVPDNFKIHTLNLDSGVGDTILADLNIAKLIIDGGVGDTDITSCLIKNGEFDIGVGDVTLNDCILYDAEIDGGVGDIDINIKENIDNYTFDIDSGIGSVRINGQKASTYSQNKGKYEIKCDTGIGDVKINID